MNGADAEEFLGFGMRRALFGPFTVSLLRSRSGNADQEEHSHRSPHFLLPLDAGFVSDCWRYDGDAPGGQVIWTPAGWSHRDSMARLHGRFAIIARADAGVGDPAAPSPDFAVALRDPGVMALAHRIVTAMLSDPPAHPRLVEGLCVELFDFGRVDDTRPPPRRIAHALDRAMGDFGVSMAELASEAGLDPASFSRAFRRHFRCAPTEAKRWGRMAAGASALRDGAAPIAGIALDLGYFDQSHFGRQFRAAFHCTPAQYQRRFAGLAAPA